MRGLACRRCPARRECAAHAARFVQGYELPAAARALLPAWRKTRPLVSVFAAIGNVIAILTVAVLHLLVVGYSLWLAAVLYAPAVLMISRMLRGLEVLLHEGSHYNWMRHRSHNDLLVNVFAGFLVFQMVQDYRISHARHHKQLGGDDDPCRRRFVQFGWGNLSRGSAAAYVRGMVSALPAYSANWWRLVCGNRRTVTCGALWHAGAVVLPLAAVLTLRFSFGVAESAGLAALAWLAYVGAGFTAVLPALRFVAEAAEHDYKSGTTTRTATFNNVGLLHWFLHPHGDGYHFLHHVDANIPHHRLRAVHAWLTRYDPEYASSRSREHILDDAS